MADHPRMAHTARRRPRVAHSFAPVSATALHLGYDRKAPSEVP